MDYAYLARIGVPVVGEAWAAVAAARMCNPPASRPSKALSTLADADATSNRRTTSLHQKTTLHAHGSAAPVATSTGKASSRRLSTPLIDIGANMLDPMFHGVYRDKERHQSDFDDVLARAFQANVTRLVVTAGNLEEAAQALELCQQYRGREGVPQLVSTVGVHPTRCSEFDSALPEGPEHYLRRLAEVGQRGAASGSIVAAGELGLDYDRLEFCPKEVQLKYFEAQLTGLAAPLKLPLFLHCRTSDAAKDLQQILSKHIEALPSPPGVVHSFDGTLEDAQALMELGFCIGLNGCSLRTAENLEVVKQLPLEKLLLETDAPWCSIKATHAGHVHVQSTWPEVKKPERWEAGSCVKDRCEPCHLQQVLEVVAGCRGMDTDVLAKEVNKNTLRVFFPRELEA